MGVALPVATLALVTVLALLLICAYCHGRGTAAGVVAAAGIAAGAVLAAAMDAGAGASTRFGGGQARTIRAPRGAKIDSAAPAAYSGKSLAMEKDSPLRTGEELEAIREVEAKKVPAKELPMRGLPVKVPDLARRLPYRPKAAPRTSLHVGQRKLLLSEVDFLIDHAREGDTVVYAGAAPGIHIPFLASLFEVKHLHFELYDPRAFEIGESDGAGNGGRSDGYDINAYQEFFTDETAQKYAGRDDVLFVSDIRTGNDDGSFPSENMVVDDMMAQMRWVRSMNPRAAMLKFRLRYNHDEPFEYLAGEPRLQIWAPQSSTETRLVAARPYPVASYDPRDYEERKPPPAER